MKMARALPVLSPTVLCSLAFGLVHLLPASSGSATAKSPRPLPLLQESPPIPASVTRCRCVPQNACWDAVPWGVLNTSVHGRLQVSRDEVHECLGTGLDTDACTKVTDPFLSH